jgi:hypothetical protein
MAGQRFFFEEKVKARARSRAPLLNPPLRCAQGRRQKQEQEQERNQDQDGSQLSLG